MSQLSEAAVESEPGSCPVQQLCIIYDNFKAALATSSATLLVPLVTARQAEEYRFTVFGRCDNRNFVLPISYQFSGQQAAYGLQKALYIGKHNSASASAERETDSLSPLITSKDITLNFGKRL